MIVKGNQVQRVEIELSEYELLSYTIDLINARFKLHGRWLDADGIRIMQDETGWRHGSISDEFVREATEQDKKALELRDFMQTIRMEISNEMNKKLRSG
jgi:hypothetical protein